LGNDVNAELVDCCDVTGIGIHVGMIQSSKFSTEYVDEMIDKFICDFYCEYVKNKSNFMKYIGLVGEMPHKIDVTTKVTWKHSEVVAIFELYLLPSGKFYRKLSTQLVPRNIQKIISGKSCKRGTKMRGKQKKNVDYLVGDIDEFKLSCECYPHEITGENIEDDYI